MEGYVRINYKKPVFKFVIMLFLVGAMLFFLFFTLPCFSNYPIDLMPNRIFDEEKHNLFFKSLPFITATDTHLIISKNQDHVLWRLDLNTEKIDTIGGRGEGPGEYFQPTKVAAFGDTIALLHNGNVSFFNSKTKEFINRFRTFIPFYPLSLSINEDRLMVFAYYRKKPIMEYSWEGEKVKEFGEPVVLSNDKYSFTNQKQYSTLMGLLNDFITLYHDNECFLINRSLSFVKKYSRTGHKTKEFSINYNGKISPIAFSDSKVDQIVKKWIKGDFKLVESSIDSAEVFDDLLFLSIIKERSADESGVKHGILFVLSAVDNSVLEEFHFYAPEKHIIQGFRGLGIRASNDSYFVYFGMVTLSEDDRFIAEYKIKKVNRRL